MTANSKKLIPLSLGILSACFITLNIIRVYYVPITYDEAWTYNDFVSKGYVNIFGFDPLIANNHPVNSLLTKLFVSIFGPGVLVLRLANVLAQVLFLVYSALLVHRLFKNYGWVIAAFLLLNLNPFIFDFWGLCRGYGLSLAFMMASAYYLLQYLWTDKRKYLHLLLVFAILSVYSNFSLLNFHLAAIGVFGLYRLLKLKEDRRGFLVDVAIVIGYTGLLYLLIARPMARLKEANELYYGSGDGIVRGTFYSLARESLFVYDDQRVLILIIAYTAAISVVLTGLYWIITWWKNKNDKPAVTGLAAWLLLAIPLLSMELQHILFDNLYLIERTALFLYPLFIFQLAYCLYLLYTKYKWPAQLAMLTLTVAFSFNFIKNINFSYARSWQIDRYNTIVLDRMIKSKTYQKLKIRVNWQFLSSLNYYVSTKYRAHFHPLEDRWSEPQPGGVYDYYYLTSEDKDMVPAGYSVDTTFESGKYILYRKTDTGN